MAAATVMMPPGGHTMKLSKMVDLALGTPEVGAVNFNMLHSLLHAMLGKMHLDDATASFDDTGAITIGQPSRSGTGRGDDGESVITQDSGMEPDGSSSTSFRIHTPYHQLQDRVDILERQISVLNSVPSGKQLVDVFFGAQGPSTDTKPPADGADGKPGVSEVWQSVQMKRKIDSNEEGLTRVGSVVDELMKEMRRLRVQNENLMQQVKDLSQMSSVWERMKVIEGDITNLTDLINQLKSHMALYPPPESFSNYVTWEGLEKALRGIKDKMDELNKPTERIVINMGTDPMSRPQSAASSRSGPSEALQELLENLGCLTTKHEKLDDRVVVLEGEMPNKADKKDLDGLAVPEDLLQKIADIRSQLDNLLNLRNRDNEAMSRIREALSKVQNDMDKLNDVVKKLVEDSSGSLSRIEELMNITSDHEGRKADVAYVDLKVEPKADIKALNGKVNMNIFDETTGNLHKMLEDLLKRLLDSDGDLRKLLDSLTNEMDGKLDRGELEPLKDWLEKRLKALAAKIKGSGRMPDSEDEAAGLRKQLLQHFHCISCDRPLNVAPHDPYPSIPDRQGMPAMRSMRPFTTFELDAIRQHAKGGSHTEVVDAYQTPRPCGGSHTVNPMTKRTPRTLAGNGYDEDNSGTPVPRFFKEELDLQGVDGHIYKGRLDFTAYGQVQQDPERLPPVTQQAAGRSGAAPINSERPKSSRVSTPRQGSARVQRPMSARTPSIPESRQASVPIPSPEPSAIIDMEEPAAAATEVN